MGRGGTLSLSKHPLALVGLQPELGWDFSVVNVPFPGPAGRDPVAPAAAPPTAPATTHAKSAASCGCPSRRSLQAPPPARRPKGRAGVPIGPAAGTTPARLLHASDTGACGDI